MSLLRNVGYSSAGQVARVVLGLANSILLARWLGPADYGTYALLIATIGLLNLVGGFGLQSAFGFVVGKRRYPVPQIAGHVVWLCLAVAVAIALLVYAIPTKFVSVLLGDLSPKALWLAFALALSTLLLGFVNGILLGLDKIKLLVLLSTSGVLLNTMLILVLLVALGWGITGAILQLVLSGIVMSCAAAVVLVRTAGIDLRPNPKLIREMLIFGGKLHPGYLGYNLLNRVDIYFVNHFGGTAATGLYSIAVGVAEKLWIIDQSVSQAVTPQIISLDRVRAGELTRRSFRLAFWTVALFAACSALLSPVLIPLVYGAEYIHSVPAFILLLPGIVFLSTRIISPYFSMQLGRPEIPTFYGLSVGLVSLPVYYFATREYGYLGAAFATTLVYGVLALVTVFLFVAYSGGGWFRTLFVMREDLTYIRGVVRKRAKTFTWRTVS